MKLPNNTDAARSFSTDIAPPVNQVSRRTLIKAGWVVPTVVALELSGVKLALAVSGGGGNPPPVSQTGCSHGFWKNHANAWPTPYTTTTLLNSVFTIPGSLGISSTATLLTALNYNATGSTVLGAAQRLLLQAAAALLNSAKPSLNYPLTTSQVINQVNTALAIVNANPPVSDNVKKTTMDTLKTTLDGYNNLTCPL